MNKLHLACGPVYLEGYTNIDIKGKVKDPELIKKNKTTLDKYFKWDYVKQPIGHNKRKEIVVDKLADVRKLNFIQDNSVDEILTVNLIDHMKYSDFVKTLKEWRRVLKVGGQLIIDVGDIIENCDLLVKAKTKEEFEWALRLIYCHSRDRFDSHYWGYDADYLKELLKENGFKFVWKRRNYIKHVYPAFQICVAKNENK